MNCKILKILTCNLRKYLQLLHIAYILYMYVICFPFHNTSKSNLFLFDLKTNFHSSSLLLSKISFTLLPIISSSNKMELLCTPAAIPALDLTISGSLYLSISFKEKLGSFLVSPFSVFTSYFYFLFSLWFPFWCLFMCP